MVSFTEAPSKSNLHVKQDSKSSSGTAEPFNGRYRLWHYFVVVGLFILLTDGLWTTYLSPMLVDRPELHTSLRIVVTLLQILVFIYPMRGLRTIGGYFLDYQHKLIPSIPANVRSNFKEIQAALNAVQGIHYKNDELEALRQAKEREQNAFFANISHELRTPLTTIQGILDLLNDGDLGDLNPDQQHYIETAQKAMDRLMPMVNNVIDISKAEANRLEVEYVPFVAMDEVVAVVEQFSATARRKQIKLDYDVANDLPEVVGDPYRFRQVLLNLVSNAVKYTDEGGMIQLRAHLCPGDDHTVCFEVSDNGVGISEEGLKHIGEKFYQVRVRDAKKGSGLGLAIVKELVHLMHGDMHVQSQEGKGTTFIVMMPVYEESLNGID